MVTFSSGLTKSGSRAQQVAARRVSDAIGFGRLGTRVDVVEVGGEDGVGGGMGCRSEEGGVQ